MAVVRLQPGRQKRVLGGHPWVYKTEIDEVHGHYEPGDVVDVVDHRGRFVARGYINLASQIAVRVLTRNAGEKIDREFFRRRLEAAIAYRQRVVGNTDAYRLVFGEADFLPALIVDYYAGYLTVQTLALGIERYKELIIELLTELVQPRGIYERNDVSVRQLEGLPLISGFIGEPFPTRIRIRENDLEFIVDLAGGQKTGYFLDQRENRLLVRLLAPGLRVLDAFCHSGAFGIYAAAAGAREVMATDISEEALELARENAALNGVAERMTFVAANAFDELRALERRREKFDLIVLDPPAFTKSKEALPGAYRGYKEINLRAMRLLRPGGFLVTCSCSYHMQESLFLEMLLEAARDTGKQLRLIEMRRQAKDHPMLLAGPETYYLKCAVLQVW